MTETRTIRSGGATKDDLLLRLEQHCVGLNEYAHALFGDQDFETSRDARDIRVEFVSLADLDLPDGGRFDEIVTQAAKRGLKPCPLEVGPHLRLSYLDQPEGAYLTVASLELRPGPDTPNGFYLRRVEGKLWLRGYESGPENVYPPDFSRFVFMHPPTTISPTSDP